jgi:predicted Zn-dependent protease
MMRARALLSIYTNTPQQAASRIAQEGAEQAAQNYLDALIAARNGQNDSALEQLDKLANEHPDFAMLPASAASVALEAGRYNEAIQRSQRLLRFMPNYLPAQLILAEAQLQRDPQAAYQLLNDVTVQNPENPQGFNLLAEAAGRSGHDSWGHLARAEYLQLTGRVDRGIRQLSIARDAAERENDQQALAKIEQRREDFIDYREALEDFN